MNQLTSDNTTPSAPLPLAGREEQARLKAYWQLEDSTCREFLKFGQLPHLFETVRLAFPFVRVNSQFRTSREWGSLPIYLYFGFYAAVDLAGRHPELAKLVLPPREIEPTQQRLRLLIKWADGDLRGNGLLNGFKAVAKTSLPETPDANLDEITGGLLLKTFQVAFYLVTEAVKSETFAAVGALYQPAVQSPFKGLLERAITAAPLRVHRQGITFALQHPLLQCATEIYPEQSLEGRTIGGFLAKHLETLGVKGTECPGGELDLLDWVDAGVKFGRELRQQQPEVLKAILDETAGARLESAKETIHQVTGAAGSLRPLSLIRPLLDWYRQTCERAEPIYYGQRLARVATIADFAVWIPWIKEAKLKKG